MGHRANLLIVEGREYSLYYSHWCAYTITSDLFWGSQHALDFIREQRAVEKSEWLDDVWAEGGAVIDSSNRILLLYGSYDFLYDVPLRRIYLEMLRRVWRGWEIRWADEGIADIADYVGYPRSNVITTCKSEYIPNELSLPQEREWTDLVGSVRTAEGRLELFPLAGDVEFYLCDGPGLDKKIKRTTSFEFIPLDEWIEDGFPSSGFHVDKKAKRLDYWAANDVADIPRRIARSWQGWEVTWHRDAFEYQLKLTDGRLQFPNRPREQLEQRVRELLLLDDSRRSVNTIQNNTLNQMDNWLTPNLTERERIIELSLRAQDKI
jgi:hypothetical protein